MAYAYLGGVAEKSVNFNDVTTGTLDTSGADLIVAVKSWHDTTEPAITDSGTGNSWTAIGGVTSNVLGIRTRHYYCIPVDTSATHTFTSTQANSYPGLAVMAFSGAHASPVGTQSAGAGQNSGTTIQPGSLTPSEDDCLVISGIASYDDGSAAPSIDGGFTTVGVDSGTGIGASIAYLIQTTAAAANPTWTFASGVVYCATVSTFFKAAASGPSAFPHHYYQQLGG